MKTIKHITIFSLLLISELLLAQTKQTVTTFDKVIISPHIETTFVQGNVESVTILESTVPEDKINIEVKNKTLRVYLDDAKETTKQEQVKKNGVTMKVPIYKGKVLTIIVTYKTLEELSLRGEQRTFCEGAMDSKRFKLKIYGESQVTFNEVNFSEFDVDIYGESQLTISKGRIDNQMISAYGESDINLVAVENRTSRIKAYGESVFKIQASKEIKFTAYGESVLLYKGTAEVNRGLSFGDSEVTRID